MMKKIFCLAALSLLFLSCGIQYRQKAIESEMVFVEGGTFWMGNTDEGADPDEAPVHQVTLGDYYIGKYEVTQAQWRAVMGTTMVQWRNKVDPTFNLCGVGDDWPMYYVNWNEVQQFIERLNAATGKKYVLPTEAQWEYAARGGNKSQDYTYSGSNNIDDVAWYMSNSGGATHPVGTKQPNELGIYDMSGNVYEWCADWYGVYPSAQQTNLTANLSVESYRVNRGGSWDNSARFCNSTNRFSLPPDSHHVFLGFRLVLLP